MLTDVDLDNADQQRFALHFDDLTTAHPTVPAAEGAPNVLPVGSENGKANHWHTDVTSVLNPPQASTLRSLVIPPYAGETLIANAATAYRDLPEALRDFAEALWALHANDYDDAVPPQTVDEAERERRTEFISIKYQTAHPIVRVHRLTGERGLFVGGFAQRIVGPVHRRVPGILRILQSYVTRPENVLRLRWAPHRITQHSPSTTTTTCRAGCTT